jgi:D-alanine-D-alanine ligase
MHVGVVFGGRSVEHDVSVVTAHQAMDVLARKHTVVPIYITREGRWLTGSGLHDLGVYKKRRWDDVGTSAWLSPSPGEGFFTDGGRMRGPRRIPLDVVVPSVHGTYGEDGTLQGLFELADVPYTGSGVAASAIGMDKVAMKAAFRSAQLPVVTDVVVDALRFDAGHVAGIESRIGYPAFVKPARLGSSVGIAKATDRESLLGALDVARRYDRRLLVEVAMEGCIEINCSVLGGPGVEPRVSVCEQPLAWEEFLTFSDKYLRGGKSAGKGMAGLDRRIPAPISDALTKQVQENAVAAFRSIDAAGVARVDSFVNEATGETWVMEINTMPGSFSFYLWEASGLAFEALLDELIDVALSAHRQRAELLFSYDSGMLDVEGAKTGG